LKRVASVTTMFEINRTAILDVLRKDQPISRSEIAQTLGLSAPTVSRIIDNLTEEGLVETMGARNSSGGRPGTLLKFDGSNFLVIGIDLGGTKMYGTIADLNGTIHYEIYKEHYQYKDKIAYLYALIEELIEAPRAGNQKLRGIGIGVPGLTTTPDGVVTWAPSLNWREVPLKRMVEERFDLPVYVENDVNLASLGEWNFGASSRCHSLVYITVGTGIGAGLVINGKLLKGFAQAAGEVGFLVSDVNALGKPYHDYGHLESQASGLGIARKAQTRLAQQGRSPTPVTTKEVFAAAHRGESWASEIVAETVDLLALAIANISALINPEVVVLGGGVTTSLQPEIATLENRLQGVIPYPPRIEVTQLGSRGAVLGAISLVMDGTMPTRMVSHV
jgi:predicted NBD/HSP70 family sugar kinase